MSNSTHTAILTLFVILYSLCLPVWAETVGAYTGSTLVVLDLELTGDLSDSRRDDEWAKRRQLTSAALRQALNQQHAYNVVDSATTLQAIDASGATPPFHTCNGCELGVARRLNAKYVLLGWVSRVSNLVLSMNLEIKDVATGNTVLRKGFDFRGDNDKSWLKAVEYFVKNL